MQELLQAIASKWDATPALLTAFPGGLHQGRSEENQPSGDYCIYCAISAPATQVFGNPDLKYTAELQFDGFFSDPTNAATNMDLLTGTYQNTLLTLTGGRENTMVRCTDAPTPVDDLDQNLDSVRNLKHWRVSFSWHVE